MCIEALSIEIEEEREKMTKSIKISDNAHKALEFAKVMEGVKIGKLASLAIIEAIQHDYPEAYKALKKHLLIESEN